MTKYQYKFLQNYFHYNNVLFMKSWDLTTVEFDHDPEKNSASIYIESIKDFLARDYELLL